MRSELFSAENLEKESAQPGMRLQNSKMLKVELNGEIDGPGRVDGRLPGPGAVPGARLGRHRQVPQAEAHRRGRPADEGHRPGDVFLADRAADVHLIDLEPGDALSINGANVLAFDSTLQYDIKMVAGRRA